MTTDLLHCLPGRRDCFACRKRRCIRRNPPTESLQPRPDQQRADGMTNWTGNFGRASVPNVDAQHPVCRRQIGASRISREEWKPGTYGSLQAKGAPWRNDLVLWIEHRLNPEIGALWRSGPEPTANWEPIAVCDGGLCHPIAIRAHCVSKEPGGDAMCRSSRRHQQGQQSSSEHYRDDP